MAAEEAAEAEAVAAEEAVAAASRLIKSATASPPADEMSPPAQCWRGGRRDRRCLAYSREARRGSKSEVARGREKRMHV